MAHTEIAYSTTGVAYEINPKTKKAVKVYQDMSSLKELKEQIQKANSDSLTTYLKYMKAQFPDEVFKQKSNYFDFKGYRVKFTDDGVRIYDLMAFSKEVNMEHRITPSSLKEFFVAVMEPTKRAFSSKEMVAAEERGKKLLEERKEVPVAEIAKVMGTEELEQAKKRALALIKRIKTKSSAPDKLFTIRDMFDFRRIRINLSLAFKKYDAGELRWGKLVTKVEEVIVAEDFKAKPTRAEYFTGFDEQKWSKCANSISGNIIQVDGKDTAACCFYLKELLQKSAHPECYIQVMKWLRGEITDDQLLEKPIDRDPYTHFDKALLPTTTEKHLPTVIKLMYKMKFLPPHRRLFTAETMAKHTRVLVTFDEYLSIDEGRVSHCNKGIWVVYATEKGEWPISINQQIEILK